MADTVVEHHHETTEGGSSGVIIGIVILAILVFLAIFYFGFGSLNFGGGTTSTPAVPEQVDVNINR